MGRPPERNRGDPHRTRHGTDRATRHSPANRACRPETLPAASRNPRHRIPRKDSTGAAMKYVLLLSIAAVALAQQTLPPELQNIRIDQRLGSQVPLRTQFVDEHGSTVELGSLIHDRPVLLAMVYYECPMLCSQILSGVVSGLRPLALRSGRDFDVIAISINPAETRDEAISKKALYTRRYGDANGWHFLVGSEEAIRTVSDAVGFHYRYDPKTKMFIHASGVMILTPEGKISRYLYGVEYTPKDLKLALMESSNRRIGSPADQILLFCYHYDPATGKYGAIAMSSLRAASTLTIVALVIGLTILWRRELRERRRAMS